MRKTKGQATIPGVLQKELILGRILMIAIYELLSVMNTK